MLWCRFLSAERLPGVLIVTGLIAGLAAVNSPLRPVYEYAHHATVHLGIGPLTSDEPLILWVNDGLMVFFFLLVGMEIKRELLQGHLSTFRQAALPVYAAVEIGRAHVWTPVTNAHLVCRLLIEK